MEALTALQEAVAAAAATVAPSVVAVGRGAGLVVADGAVLTNAHNLTAEGVPVGFADGEHLTGEVLAADVDGDLAVVRVDTGGRPAPPWAAAAPALGAAVLAVGPPRHHGAGRITVGFVSAIDRPFRGPRGRRLRGIEHTAPRGRGSSGGPLLDVSGHVVGLDTHRLGGAFYLAQPVGDGLRGRVDDLLGGRQPSRRRLGIAVAPPRVARQLRDAVGLEPREGVLIRDLDPDGPGATAGLRRGDLVIAADGVATPTPDDLLDRLDAAGDAIDLLVVRGDDEQRLTVPLPERSTT
jgi:serine protease Do